MFVVVGIDQWDEGSHKSVIIYRLYGIFIVAT